MGRWRSDNPKQVSQMPVIEDEPVAITSAPSEVGPQVAKLRLLWNERRFLFRLVAFGLACSAAIAFLIPKRYDSTVRLMLWTRPWKEWPCWPLSLIKRAD